ncbi:hypothetical protein VE03_07236 [Pseudogymnoascus sp. 23342-1-I1]|nr:hypothetical protein VE03_07236 [Pseudogymnoascus sp. 23342-1-I1]
MEDVSVYHPSNLLYAQEPLSRYRQGGCHPVTLGDAFDDGRYTVLHKLGWGSYSTVWLARDKRGNRWVALKIMSAESTEKSREICNLLALSNSSQEGLAAHYIVQLLDEFTHDGPNGTHECLVFELLGPTVAFIVEEFHATSEKLEPEVILRMSGQLLQATAFIHGARLVHGDINSRNIAFTSGSLSRCASEESLFKIIGSPKIEPLARIDGAPLRPGLPKELVKAVEWDNWIDEDEENIRLLGFSQTFTQGAEPERIDQPSDLKAPETIFTDRFDYRLDLWRVGFAIYFFVFGVMPFQYTFGVDSDLVDQMINFVEDLPAEWE